MSNDPCCPHSPGGWFSVSLVGICDRPHPCLNLPSEELETLKFTWGRRSLASPPRLSAGGTKPEGDELLDHLRLSILPWDESILDTLSPKLTAGADAAGGQAQGVVSCDRERERDETEGVFFWVWWRKAILHVGGGADREGRPVGAPTLGPGPCQSPLPWGHGQRRADSS